VQRAKDHLVNEFWAHELRVDVRPRLHLPSWLRGMLLPLRPHLVEPFQLAELAKLTPGRLVDLGCGNGDMLVMAGQLGWEAIGIELDPAAAQVSRVRTGGVVLEGSYARLGELRGEIDCVICSHVLEHVQNPLDMLASIAEALRPGGILLLSLPNATSSMRQHFGDDWRGLEAPRHLSIPSMRQLTATLAETGFSVRQRPLTRLWTATESFRIRRRGIRTNSQDRAAARQLARNSAPESTAQYDFAELVCIRTSADE
jgi:2-polyprenyl-3-methyl-5-hydroxy-6-metoxy-1,4-benzoquinol methylase